MVICHHGWKIVSYEVKTIEIEAVPDNRKFLTRKQKIRCVDSGLEETRSFAEEILPENRKFLGKSIYWLNPDGTAGDLIAMHAGMPENKRRAILDKTTLLPVIKSPELPVLSVSIAKNEFGDPEDLGYFNGRPEDILAVCAPLAVNMPKRFQADYEVTAWIYDPEESQAKLSWNPFENEERIIKSVPPGMPMGMKVAVCLPNTGDADKLIGLLDKGTRYKREAWIQGVVIVEL